jgi:hypothetical protein
VAAEGVERRLAAILSADVIGYIFDGLRKAGLKE